MDNKKIVVPIATTNNNDLISIEFKQSCRLTLISGKPGTGKSTIIRQMLTYVSKNNIERPVEVFLADTTGYEFNNKDEFETNIIKRSMLGMDEKNIEGFIDEIYNEFLKKRNTVIKENNWENIDMFPKNENMPVSIVIIDDICVLIEKFSSREYIIKLIELIETGWYCGFTFVFLCQDFRYAYMKLPMSMCEMIDQKIFLSPYTSEDILYFFGKIIENNNERFSVAVEKKGKELEFGKLIYGGLK